MNNKTTYSPHSLMGRGGKFGATNGMVIVCAVQELCCNGDNFNTSLCGKKPKGISLGWYRVSREINCEKCIKKYKKLTEVGSDENE